MGALLRRLDAMQRDYRWSAFAFAVVKKFGDDQAGNLAALISYYALFSIFPLLLALSTILKFVLHGHPQWQQDVTNSALSTLPLAHIQTGTAKGGSIVALVIGVVLALYSGLGVAKTAQTAFDTVYLVSRTDRPGFLPSTLRALRIVVLGGLGFILTTALSGAVTNAHSLGGLTLGPGLRILGYVIGILLNTALFVVLFRWLTVRHVTARHVLPGAIVAAVALQILQSVAQAFIAHKLKGASTTYGKDVGGVIVLMSWFYLQAQVLLLSAEVNVVRQFRLWPRALSSPPETDADFRAYEAYAERERRAPEEDVDTSYDGSDAAAGDQTVGHGGAADSDTARPTGESDTSGAEKAKEPAASATGSSQASLVRLRRGGPGRPAGPSGPG